jgi:hypothetical protein
MRGTMIAKTWPAAVSLALAASMAAPVPASAQDASNFVLRGFVSQGYLKSSANRLLDADTDEGTFAFTEAALNFTAQPLPKVRVAAQLFARDFGTQGNNRLTLDWGVGEYRAWDQLGFRIGRVKFPVGLYNTLQDADVARPEIFQPSGLYPPERRDLTNAIDGAGIFGTLQLGGAGYLEYEGLYGTLDLEDSYLLVRATNQLSAALVPPLTALRFSNLSYVVAEREGRAKYGWGGYVEWHPPLSGLRLRGGMQGASVDFAAVTAYSAFVGTAPVSLSIRSAAHYAVPHQVVFSGEYNRGGLRLTAEHSRLKTEGSTTLTGTPFPAPPATVTIAHPTSTYGQVAYRLNEHFQASGYYSVSYADRDDKDGRALAARGQAASGAWVKDLAFTLRADVNAHWLIKAEVHRFDGTYNLSAVENPKPLDKDWTLFAIKTTFHF